MFGSLQIQLHLLLILIKTNMANWKDVLDELREMGGTHDA